MLKFDELIELNEKTLADLYGWKIQSDQVFKEEKY